MTTIRRILANLLFDTGRLLQRLAYLLYPDDDFFPEDDIQEAD
jgi:hypothetical protein